MMPRAISYDFVKTLFLRRAHRFREEREFANIFGYRNKELAVDLFNDIIGVAYLDGFGNPQCLIFPGTTKPGLHYLKDELGNPKGTFIMQPGQYPDCWTPGMHNGKYDAWIQAGFGVFNGWRDLNADGKLDYSGKTYTDCSGVDGHTTRFDIDIERVGAFSAGCQVLEDDKHFLTWYNIGLRTLDVHKIRKITYTLFQEQ